MTVFSYNLLCSNHNFEYGMYLEAYSESSQTSKIELFFDNIQRLSVVKYFCKKLHLRCLTTF